MARIGFLILTMALALACGEKSQPTVEVAEITATELQSRAGEVVILDVRTAKEFEAGRVPGAINISHDELQARLSEIAQHKDREIVVYCERGGRATKANELLQAQGFQKLSHLQGDMSGWRDAGHPVEKPVDPATQQLATSAKSIFGALPASAPNAANPPSDAKIALGRMLYYEPRLSKNHDVSCNSCHALDNFGQDNRAFSPGHRGQLGGRSSPSVYNAALHVAQFWDGRAADVEEQAKGPILNPVEMAMPDAEAVLVVLNSIPGYVDAFAAAFPGEEAAVSYDNLGLAIGVFERQLITPSRFDDFMAGDLDALNEAELAGLQTFMTTGCITCHMGSTVGGQDYKLLGLVKPYETADAGRFDVTGIESDRGVFKVPSLRNVAKTAPYFHDGSIATLDLAIRTMAEHQLGKTLTDAEVASIATFLESLTGRVDVEYIAMPELPASGPETPAPDPS